MNRATLWCLTHNQWWHECRKAEDDHGDPDDPGQCEVEDRPLAGPEQLPAPFSSEAYLSRTAGGSRVTGYDCCLCGKQTPREGKVLHVRTILGAEIVHPDAELEQDSGWFPVGSDCARKLPAGYTRKLDLDELLDASCE